jgi:hypothetical protein
VTHHHHSDAALRARLRQLADEPRRFGGVSDDAIEIATVAEPTRKARCKSSSPFLAGKAEAPLYNPN